ncbi:MAG: hypothetical protein A2808_01970 [Candidatus Moranbacteria bacterium RIFCSPHIGHO2_01_FULL_55_24]|nr:MAG: hypothetical protein A2808_01970 [Candidatus Moranbacteria bacterium RIFCSPHIGHO2_01_FULL_55_24]
MSTKPKEAIMKLRASSLSVIISFGLAAAAVAGGASLSSKDKGGPASAQKISFVYSQEEAERYRYRSEHCTEVNQGVNSSRRYGEKPSRYDSDEQEKCAFYQEIELKGLPVEAAVSE